MTARDKLTVYRTCAPAVDAQYDPGGAGTIATTLVEAVATAEGIDPIDLPPLHDAIDLDAVGHLFEDHDDTAGEETLLGFSFGEWNIFIRSDGRIRVCDGTAQGEPEQVFAD